MNIETVKRPLVRNGIPPDVLLDGKEVIAVERYLIFSQKRRANVSENERKKIWDAIDKANWHGFVPCVEFGKIIWKQAAEPPPNKTQAKRWRKLAYNLTLPENFRDKKPLEYDPEGKGYLYSIVACHDCGSEFRSMHLDKEPPAALCDKCDYRLYGPKNVKGEQKVAVAEPLPF